MSDHDYLNTLILQIPNTITAIAGLVSAVAALVWSWRQEKRLQEVTEEMKYHERHCPGRTNGRGSNGGQNE